MSSFSKKKGKYLQLTPLEDAVSNYLKQFNNLYPISEEPIDVKSSLNHVISRPIQARISSPFYRASAMDGYAVLSERTSEASESQPISLEIGKDAIPVDTGNPIPQGFNAVVMIEDTYKKSPNQIEITKSCSQGQHIRETGEDAVISEMLYPSGHRVRPQDIGFLLSTGILQIYVRKKPIVGIIPTGSDIISPEQLNAESLKAGSIIDSSSSMLAAFLDVLGATSHITKVIPDDENIFKSLVMEESKKCDIVLIIAGSSAGREDLTASLLAQIGKVFVHGIAIAPGKPTVLSSVNGKPCLGMPGYPVSTLIIAEYILKPLIFRMLGIPFVSPIKHKATLVSPLPSKLGSEEFIRVGLGKIGGKLLAIPLSRNASSLSSYVRADGIVRISRLSEGFSEESEVEVEVFTPMERLEKKLIHQGSHDLCMDALFDIIWKNKGIWLSSFNIGSLAGLYALKRGHSHIAGCHLLNPSDGTYNIWAVKEYIPDIPVKIVHLAFREQGIMIAKGNPLNINKINDLSNNKVRFVNRQKGSGTRILLDYLLKKANISPDMVNGYDREEYTHLNVASKIAEGSADAGIGLRASAGVLGLEFVPLVREEYDLIVPEAFYTDERIQEMLYVLKTEEFRVRIGALSGYDPSRSGEVIDI